MIIISFFRNRYEELGDKYSDFNDMFKDMEEVIKSIPDKLTPIFSEITGEKGKGIISWLTK